MSAALRVATRGSVLARWQAERIVQLLGVTAELVIVSTSGDRRLDVPIRELGGAGIFVKEVEDAVLDGRADVAVHSAKDLPSTTADGLALAAVPERADPRDALVGCALDRLPTGARVGTGSVRRRAQLVAARSDLVFGELRGNIPTRLEKVAGFDTIVVAMAALERLGCAERATEVLDPSLMLPQVAQGALAVECRVDDEPTHEVLRRIDDARVHAAVDAERAFLAELGGGCNLPCGALASIAGDGTITIDAMLATPDGRVLLRDRAEGREPRAVGVSVAHRLLDDHGGRTLLEDVA